MHKEITCIVCPIGCRMTVLETDGTLEIKGNMCPRGENYAIEEFKNPTRMVPTTVKIQGAFLRRLPVITSQPIPKDKIFDIMEVINKAEVKAPVTLGDVIIKNILDLGVDIVATRSMNEK